jgi:hypothetical protein
MRETRKRRQRGSCPNEKSRAYRSYVGPSGAKSSRAVTSATLRIMALVDDLERMAKAAEAPGERVTGVLAAELLDGRRVYLCAYESRAWLALDEDAHPLATRQAVHEAAALTALCEVAEEASPDTAEVVPPPRVATNAYLDALGAAARRFEHEHGSSGPSPFGSALESAFAAVEELADQVVARHRTPLA